MYRQMLTGVWVNLSKHRDFGHSVVADRHHETQNTACASLISVWEKKMTLNEFMLMPCPSIGPIVLDGYKLLWLGPNLLIGFKLNFSGLTFMIWTYLE